MLEILSIDILSVNNKLNNMSYPFPSYNFTSDLSINKYINI